MTIEGYRLNIKALGIAYSTSYNNIPCFVYEGEVWSVLSSLASSTISSIKAIKMVICNGHILDFNDKEKSKIVDILLNKNGERKNFKFLVVPDTTKFRSSLLREYLSNKYANDIVIILTAPSNISTYMVRTDNKYLYSTYSEIPYLRYIDNSMDLLTFINELKRFIKKYGECIDIENSDEYKDYCENRKSNNVAKTSAKPTKAIRFYINSAEKGGYVYTYKRNATSIEELKTDYLFKPDKTVIFGSSEDKLWDLFYVFYKGSKRSKYILVKVAPSNFNKIKTLPEGWLRVEDVINAKNPHFINIMTIHKYRKGDISSSIWSKLVDLSYALPPRDRDSIRAAIKYECMYRINAEHYEALNSLIPKYKEDGSKCNSDIIDTFNCAYKYAKIVSKIAGWFDIIKNSDFIAFMAMKHKLFRINYEAYKKIKDNLKFKEDEDN